MAGKDDPVIISEKKFEALLKNVFGFSSGMIIKIADFSLQKLSASISVSKHRSCSSSESKNAFRRDSAVDMTDAMA